MSKPDVKLTLRQGNPEDIIQANIGTDTFFELRNSDREVYLRMGDIKLQITPNIYGRLNVVRLK